MVVAAPIDAETLAQCRVLANISPRSIPFGLALASPAGISWAPDILVQPDLFVANLDEARALEWSAIQHLLLAVEVLSPSSTRADRFTKRRLYQEQQIPQYWVVDGDAQVVEVWTPDTRFPVFEHERLQWHPAGPPSRS